MSNVFFHKVERLSVGYWKPAKLHVYAVLCFFIAPYSRLSQPRIVDKVTVFHNKILKALRLNQLRKFKLPEVFHKRFCRSFIKTIFALFVRQLGYKDIDITTDRSRGPHLFFYANFVILFELHACLEGLTVRGGRGVECA